MITNVLLAFILGLVSYKLGHYYGKFERADFIHSIFDARFRREKEQLNDEFKYLKRSLLDAATKDETSN